MNLPGLEQLRALSPDLARDAADLGRAAWTNPARTPRETTAAFLGADLALGLLDLPLTLHTTMARQVGVTDTYLTDLITHLAPHVGYPQAAQALVTITAHHPYGDAHAKEARHPTQRPHDHTPTDLETHYALATASRLLDPEGAPAPEQPDITIDDILTEYGMLRTRTRTAGP